MLTAEEASQLTLVLECLHLRGLISQASNV